MNRIVLTDEQKEYLKSILEDYSSKEVIELIYKKYNILLNISKVKHYRERWNIKRKENSGRYKKGHSGTRTKNIGDEFVDSEGYIHIKIKEPNVWVEKQRYVYEKYYGTIPDGFHVIFLDQDKTNCNIENLKLVSNKTKLIAKNRHLLTKDKELTETGLLVAELISKASELSRR